MGKSRGQQRFCSAFGLLVQFFVGAALSAAGVPCWALAVFCMSGGGKNVLLSSRGQQRFCLTLGLLAQLELYVLLSEFPVELSQF